MSRLDSVIRRLQAQRACLDHAAALVADIPGPVLELGLGNGRTYDHLRERLAGREIFVFDRQIAAHPDCRPDDAHAILGDFRETLPRAGERIGRPAALAHCDIGSGEDARDEALAAAIADPLVRLLAPGAVILSDQRIGGAPLQALPLPAGVPEGRYYIYRAPA